MAVKRNLTIQLDEEVIADVKAVAARRGTSVSGLVATYLSTLATEDADYERARVEALAAMDHPAGRGDWTWDRDATYRDLP